MLRIIKYKAINLLGSFLLLAQSDTQIRNTDLKSYADELQCIYNNNIVIFPKQVGVGTSCNAYAKVKFQQNKINMVLALTKLVQLK